jgi:hypothetical protein
MPRTIQVALGSACLLVLLGALSTAVWLADAFAAGAGSRWASAALGGYSGAFERTTSPLFLVAAAAVPVVLGRDARRVRVVVQLALLATITLGILALGLTGSAARALRLDAELVASLVAPALLGLLAWSLTRPSAREWLSARRS